MSEEAILAVAGIAFAAVCIWLTVRIINRRERWAICTAAVLIVISTAVVWWGTRPREGILFDPIDMQAR
jgi:hypothetical protein